MRHINRLILFISLSFILPAGAHALETINQSSNVFKFQQKLANKGNARAQYKLACMYEFGTGIEQDFEQAKQWYEQASTAGIKAASDRLTYLSVKQQGYNQAKDAGWLNSIKKEADERKGDAMFLLAQLYRQGIGVKKDLNKSLEILDQVSLLGAADVENEMALIQQEMAVNDKAKRAKRKQQTRLVRLAVQQKQQAVELPANIAQQKELKNGASGNTPASKEPQQAQQAGAEKVLLTAKRQRYEKAMLKMKLEQQKIDEQQAWAVGGDDDAATADDEI